MSRPVSDRERSDLLLGHPYTCPNRGDGRHSEQGGDTGILLAFMGGFRCPSCDYVQLSALVVSEGVPVPRIDYYPCDKDGRRLAAMSVTVYLPEGVDPSSLVVLRPGEYVVPHPFVAATHGHCSTCGFQRTDRRHGPERST